MAKCIARRRGIHTSNGTSISFKKDDETGFYRKIEHDIRMKHLEHSTKTSGKPRVSEELYSLGNEDDWDYKFEVTGFDGKPQTIYFVESKEVN
tara:strand:+ start:887 stop:1165 length:279 start_codon:yes stop_codon:yes gene_type:complete